MAKPKLNEEQQKALLTWLAAEYSGGLILKWFKEREWPAITDSLLTYYRKKYGIVIEVLRKERRESALNTGLALKEERVKRLMQHADALEAIKWEPDDRGRLWNEKAWRETLADIAAETGGRKQAVDLTSGGEKLKPIQIVAYDYNNAVTALAPRPVDNSQSPGENQNTVDGAQVGQNANDG